MTTGSSNRGARPKCSFFRPRGARVKRRVAYGRRVVSQFDLKLRHYRETTWFGLGGLKRAGFILICVGKVWSLSTRGCPWVHLHQREEPGLVDPPVHRIRGGRESPKEAVAQR